MSKHSGNGKKKIDITPEKVDAFSGRVYTPQFEQYDSNKAGYGIWGFRIEFTQKQPPTISFAGIYRNGFIAFLTHFGYYKRFRPDGSYFFLRCIDNLIEEVDTVHISDFVTQYLEKEGTDIWHDELIAGQTVTFAASLLLQEETIKKQCHSLFNKKFLELLPNFEKDILKDTPTECFKLFKNTIVKVSKEGFEFIDYKDMGDKYVWLKHRFNFNLEYTEGFTGCHFFQFIRNVSNANADNERYLAFVSAIGYLLHTYNSPEKGQAIICNDEVITDVNKPQGGTGKGVFAKALSFISELVKIDGKKFDENQRFCFQRVTDSTQIVFFDDVKSKFGFDRFNSILTDGWEIEKKNKDEFSIKPEDSPKVLLSSNFILEYEGSTRKRRQFILEFSDFYSRHIKKGNEEPIKAHHKCVFFTDDWDNQEWQMFYSFLINCIREYFKGGLHYYEPKNVKANRLRQITSDEFAEWVNAQQFELQLNKVLETKPYFVDFRNTYYPDPEDKFSQRKFTGYLKKLASLNDWDFKHPPASDGITYFKFVKDEGDPK